MHFCLLYPMKKSRQPKILELGNSKSNQPQFFQRREFKNIKTRWFRRWRSPTSRFCHQLWPTGAFDLSLTQLFREKTIVSSNVPMVQFDQVGGDWLLRISIVEKFKEYFYFYYRYYLPIIMINKIKTGKYCLIKIYKNR